MRVFTGKVYPALAIRLGDKKFKFSGGRLVVNDEDVELIEGFAAQRPEYRIELTDEKVEVRRTPEAIYDEDAQQPTVPVTPRARRVSEMQRAVDTERALADGVPVERVDADTVPGDDTEAGEQGDGEAVVTPPPPDGDDIAADPAPTESVDMTPFEDMTNDQLRAELEKLDQPVAGNKAELHERLRAALVERARA